MGPVFLWTNAKTDHNTGHSQYSLRDVSYSTAVYIDHVPPKNMSKVDPVKVQQGDVTHPKHFYLNWSFQTMDEMLAHIFPLHLHGRALWGRMGQCLIRNGIIFGTPKAT